MDDGDMDCADEEADKIIMQMEKDVAGNGGGGGVSLICLKIQGNGMKEENK